MMGGCSFFKESDEKGWSAAKFARFRAKMTHMCNNFLYELSS